MSEGKSKGNLDELKIMSAWQSLRSNSIEKMHSVLEFADYAVFIALLLVSLGVGVFFAVRGRNQSPDDYLLNNKNMNPYA